MLGTNQAQELIPGAILALDTVLDIGPIKTGDEVTGLGQVNRSAISVRVR